MLTFNEDKIDRIAKSLEKMAGIDPNPNPPIPTDGGNVMKVTFTVESYPEVEGDPTMLRSDKSLREVSEAIISGAYVYGVIFEPSDEGVIGESILNLSFFDTVLDTGSVDYFADFIFRNCYFDIDDGGILLSSSTLNFDGSDPDNNIAYVRFSYARIPGSLLAE